MTQLQSKMSKEFYTNWIINKEKGIFLFFSIIIIFLKTPICLAFLTSGLRLFHSFIQYGKNTFLKVFDLEGMGFILVANTELKGNSLVKVISDTKRDILGINH